MRLLPTTALALAGALFFSIPPLTQADFDQDQVDALDKQWRAERKTNDQPLITAVLSNPLSTYLLRIEAGALS
jgi:hypothetical protein